MSATGTNSTSAEELAAAIWDALVQRCASAEGKREPNKVKRLVLIDSADVAAAVRSVHA
jgi:hypothetical protein